MTTYADLLEVVDRAMPPEGVRDGMRVLSGGNAGYLLALRIRQRDSGEPFVPPRGATAWLPEGGPPAYLVTVAIDRRKNKFAECLISGSSLVTSTIPQPLAWPTNITRGNGPVVSWGSPRATLDLEHVWDPWAIRCQTETNLHHAYHDDASYAFAVHRRYCFLDHRLRLFGGRVARAPISAKSYGNMLAELTVPTPFGDISLWWAARRVGYCDWTLMLSPTQIMRFARVYIRFQRARDWFVRRFFRGVIPYDVIRHVLLPQLHDLEKDVDLDG